MTAQLKRIPTKDADGNPNGYVTPIWNAAYDSYRPEQAYITSVAPGCVKGPHLHHVRSGAFTVIRGTVLIVTRVNGEYIELRCSADKPSTVYVSPGTPAAMYNMSGNEALILNMPTPPWKADDQDEHPVEGWTYQNPNGMVGSYQLIDTEVIENGISGIFGEA